MVRLLLDQAQLEIELTGVERMLAKRRTSLRIPRTDIRRVHLTDDPWTWLRGAPAPGTHIPGAVAAGRWTGPAGSDFLMVRGRRLDGAVITLVDGAEFQRIVVSTAHGLALVEALALDAIDEAAEVTVLAAEAE